MTDRPRVVFVGHVARMSGGEIALLRLLPLLGDRIDPLVVLAEDGPLVGRLRAAGVRTVVLPLGDDVRDLHRDGLVAVVRGLGELARHVVALRALIRAEGADVVHTNTLKAALYGGLAGRLAGVPVVWHVRDRIAADYLPRPVVTLVRLATRVLPAAVVANSAATLATVRPGHGTVVPDVLAPPVLAARVPHAGTVVGMVGRLTPWKGQDLFLRAFARAFAGTEVRARIVGSALFGEDAYAAGLGPLARELGVGDRVEFRGFRDDVWAELAAVDVLVHCSRTPEPFGQVVLEGMAAGLPVLAADEGGPAELIRDGVDGLLVPARDEHALAAALRRCVDDPSLRARLGRAGAERAGDFAGDDACRELLAVYARVTGHRAPAPRATARPEPARPEPSRP